MNSRKTIAATFALTLLTALPAFALDINVGANANASTSAGTGGAGVKINAATEARITKGKDRADKEIDRRVNTLTELTARMQAMGRLTAEAKASLAASIQSQISALGALKAKIAADTDLAVLKTDIKSISESYRIFLLVIPQGHITVASDKIKFVATNATTLAVKLSARIDAAAAAGKDVASLKTTLAEMQAKTSDAIVQADAALSLVVNLTPDNGDKTKAQSNSQALKDARAKIKAGMQDLITVKKDAHTITKALVEFKLEGSASTTTP